jgi:hypothetical protein
MTNTIAFCDAPCLVTLRRVGNCLDAVLVVPWTGETVNPPVPANAPVRWGTGLGPVLVLKGRGVMMAKVAVWPAPCPGSRGGDAPCPVTLTRV